MFVTLTAKTPDLLEYALDDVRENLSDPDHPNFVEDEDEREEKLYEVEEKLRKFVQNGEYLRVEVNLTTGEAKVMES